MNSQSWKKLIITLFRVAIGWHFLYEGLSKLWVENWTATGFLANATGPFAGFYRWMASSEGLMNIIDPVNIAALILIGFALFLGLAIRYASIGGIALLMLYYFAYPPFGGSLFAPAEGSLFLVNKNLIEAIALLGILLMKEKGYGIYALPWVQLKKRAVEAEVPVSSPFAHSRREALKNLATLPALGIIGLGAFREAQEFGVDTLSGATIQIGGADISELKGKLPMGMLGKHEISRLVYGGNLIGGWAHSRDLIYVPSLFRAYNTEKKIFETLMLAEKAGINTINIGFPTMETMVKYRKLTGSNIKVIVQVHPDMENNDYVVNIDKAVDSGMDIIQVQGNWCDWLVRDNRLDVIDKMLGRIRTHGITAGLGCHTVDALIACEEQGIIPDYYMQTMHHDQYWSAHPMENRVPFEVDGKKYLDHNRFHDNIFCLFPDKTVEFVQRTKVPVMGFKVLAAGAIKPEDGFKWAFENGADFICVGMFDFQVVNDVNIAIDVLNNLQGRQRGWVA
jgi:uncharacterized membrane protein YphA (DoxX/SURF4 family)